MYWPNGVPRVFAVNGPDIPPLTSSEDEELQIELSQGEEKPLDDKRLRLTAKPTAWQNEVIIGLCASRSGHLFATMTDSSVTVWQTRVCLAL